MELKELHSIYFLGVGGIGMSALARYFKSLGISVSGYDKTSTSLTHMLINEGIPVHYKEDTQKIPVDTELVIYTPAIPSDNKELLYIKDQGILMLKRSEVLGSLTSNKYTIAVAGTHGKTTITSIIAHILVSAGKNPTAFIGGIAKNFNSNLVISQDPGVFIVEADEYDRSFLQLEADIAVISAIDPDHLDIYKTEACLFESFALFARQIKSSGSLICNYKIPGDKISGKNVITYGLNSEADIYAENISIIDGTFTFDIHVKKDRIEYIKDIRSLLPGYHNIENILAAAGVAMKMNVDAKTIRDALHNYKGVERRFDYIIKTPRLVYIDDYAHHPAELAACIGAARELYPGKKITGIFQPHLYSRTRDLADGFARSLEMLDELILMDIYPAREMPIEGISAAFLLDKIKLGKKIICSKAELLETIRSRNFEVLLTMGAGDIDQFVIPISEILQNKLHIDKTIRG